MSISPEDKRFKAKRDLSNLKIINPVASGATVGPFDTSQISTSSPVSMKGVQAKSRTPIRTHTAIQMEQRVPSTMVA